MRRKLYLILRHCFELSSQGVVVGVVQECPAFLQALAHQLGLELLVAFLVAYKYQLKYNREAGFLNQWHIVICYSRAS